MTVAAPIHLRLPATSANLGPGFDALGLAMDLALHVDAVAAGEYRIDATGRDAAKCSVLEDNLILETYRSVLEQQGIDLTPLHLTLRNEIPLGMGCGSSAAALVAGVALAVHFGSLGGDTGWDAHRVLTEASLREGHPDNVAACVLGGLTVSGMQVSEGDRPARVSAISLQAKCAWPLLLVMPSASLSTSKARALLPDVYSRADAVANIQNVALLTAAFAEGRGDLLRSAMADRIHQPYRAEVCPLLPPLLPLAGDHGVLGVALSGAGPSVLLVLDEAADVDAVSKLIRQTLHGLNEGSSLEAEVVMTRVAGAAILNLD